MTQTDTASLDTAAYSGGSSMSHDSLYNVRMNTISSATAANDSIYNLIHAAINIRASFIMSENNALSSSLIYEQNEINVNNIYLSTIAVNQADSIINYSTQLYNIANQCALSGGSAVYSARSLYHLINDSIIFDDTRICNSSSDTCIVPPIPGFITGEFAGVCGKQFHYTIDSMGGVTDYTWSVAGAAVIDSGQGTMGIWVSYADTFSIGAINIYASDSCGSGAARTLTITGYPNSPTSINGNATVCANTTDNYYSIDSVQYATDYEWVVPTGDSIISGQGTTMIDVAFDSIGGNIIVIAMNECGTSDSTYLAVSINSCEGRRSHVINVTSNSGSAKLYPNPTTGSVTVIYTLPTSTGELQLFDLLGRMVNSYQLDGHKNQFNFDATYLCCGMFQYRIVDYENVIAQGKLIIIK